MKLRPSTILKLYPDSASPFLFRACGDAQLPLSLSCNPHLSICWNTICGPPLSLQSVTHIIFKSAVSKFQMTFWCIGRGKGQRAMEQIIVGSITFTLHHHSIYNAMLLHKRISKECSPKSDKCTWAQAKLPMHKMFPDPDPDNLIFRFSTLIPVALRTGCGIVEHIDFHQRIVLYRIDQPTKSIYLLFMSMGYFSSEIMILVEIKLNTIKPSGDGGRTAGSYLRTHGTTISQTERC